MIVYFSGTGNSRYCAERMAQQLDDEAVNSFHFLRDGIAAELISGKPWVFVTPTYAWQLPRVFQEFLRTGSFSGSRDVYFVMTCGSEIGNAEARIRALCKEKNWNFRGLLQVVMPENYVAMFPVPDAAEAREIIAAARPVLEAGIACIRQGQDFPAHPVGLADRMKSGPVNRIFYRLFVKAGAFRVTDACTGCGKCAASCVRNNIRMQNGRPVWSDCCTHCMACICGCPSKAVEYGKKSQGKPRYQCPAYRP